MQQAFGGSVVSHILRGKRVGDAFAQLGHDQEDSYINWFDIAPSSIRHLLRDDLIHVAWVREC